METEALGLRAVALPAAEARIFGRAEIRLIIDSTKTECSSFHT
jgi:hypothetical protein